MNTRQLIETVEDHTETDRLALTTIVQAALDQVKERYPDGISYCGDVASQLFQALKARGFKEHQGSGELAKNEIGIPYTAGHVFLRVGDFIVDAWTPESTLELKVLHKDDRAAKIDPDYRHSFDAD